jgi:DTW domain-containing protein YfiP
MKNQMETRLRREGVLLGTRNKPQKKLIQGIQEANRRSHAVFPCSREAECAAVVEMTRLLLAADCPNGRLFGWKEQLDSAGRPEQINVNGPAIPP